MSDEKRKVMDGFGERLKRFRTAAGMTLGEVAKASGLYEPYLEQVEEGLTDDPPVHVAIKLAAVFDVPVNVLVGLDVEGRPVDDPKVLDDLFRDHVGREIEALLGHDDRDRVAAFLASLGLVPLDRLHDVEKRSELWRSDSARLRSEADRARRDLAELKLIADGLLGWAGRLKRLVDGCEDRVHVARSPCRDLCPECAAKHRIEAAEARAARQDEGGVR